MKTITYALVFVLASLTPCLHAHETEEKSPAPGYRPETEYAEAFLNAVGTAQMVVYPTVVRTKTTDDFIMSYNNESQKAIIKHLTEKNIADPNACTMELDLSRVEGQGQFGLFQSSMKQMAEQIKQNYHLAAEVIIIQTPDNKSFVFGIQVYILDHAGQNAFSFLLNSHHKIFIDAKLNSKDNSKQAIEKLVENSTRLALQALELQIQQAK